MDGSIRLQKAGGKVDKTVEVVISHAQKITVTHLTVY